MLPRIIHQYWDRPEPPLDVLKRMRTWRDLNPDWQCRRWDDANTGAFIAREFGVEAARCFYACIHPAMRSDLLRASVLLTFGGIYVDADIICRQPIDAFVLGENTLMYVVRKEERRKGEVRLVNDLMALEAGHPFMAKAWQAMLDNVRNPIGLNISYVTGPRLLHRIWFDELSDEDRASVRFLDRKGTRPFFRESRELSYHREEGHWKESKGKVPIIDFDRADAIIADMAL